MSLRTEKVGSVIKRALTAPISELAKENSAGLATVTAVRMSPDLTVAKVYISVYGRNFPPAQFISILDDAKGELRRFVGSSVRLKQTPELRFFIDDTLDQIEHIQKLVYQVKPTE